MAPNTDATTNAPTTSSYFVLHEKLHLSRYKTVSGSDFTKEIPNLLSKANRYVYWTTALHPPFFNAAQVKNAIADVVGRGVHLKILVDSDSEIDEVAWLEELWKSGVVEIRRTKSSRPHRIVVDGRHLRREPRHLSTTQGDRNFIIYDTVFAQNEEIEFLRMWETSEEVSDIYRCPSPTK